MFAVTQFVTERETNCGARRAVSRVLTPFFIEHCRGYQPGYLHLLSIVVIDMASLEQFVFTPSLDKALFRLLSKEQQETLEAVLRRGVSQASTDDTDMSFKALVNREVQDILLSLLAQLTGDHTIVKPSRSCARRELVGV